MPTRTSLSVCSLQGTWTTSSSSQQLAWRHHCVTFAHCSVCSTHSDDRAQLTQTRSAPASQGLASYAMAVHSVQGEQTRSLDPEQPPAS